MPRHIGDCGLYYLTVGVGSGVSRGGSCVASFWSAQPGVKPFLRRSWASRLLVGESQEDAHASGVASFSSVVPVPFIRVVLQ